MDENDLAGPNPAKGDQEGHPDQHPLVRDLLLHPHRWRIWPAVAILRWLQRRMSNAPRLVFRSQPSLSFASSEVRDLRLHDDRMDLVLNAPGLATAGSPLPASDIARIIADQHEGGALGTWLDGPGDRFMHLLEDVQMRSNPAFALVAGGRVESLRAGSRPRRAIRAVDRWRRWHPRRHGRRGARRRAGPGGAVPRSGLGVGAWAGCSRPLRGCPRG